MSVKYKNGQELDWTARIKIEIGFVHSKVIEQSKIFANMGGKRAILLSSTRKMNVNSLSNVGLPGV